MGLHNAPLSVTPGTCRAAIHVNSTVILIFSVYCVLFRMIEYLISIMFSAGLFTPTHCVSLNENMFATISIHNNHSEAILKRTFCVSFGSYSKLLDTMLWWIMTLTQTFLYWVHKTSVFILCVKSTKTLCNHKKKATSWTLWCAPGFHVIGLWINIILPMQYISQT